MASPLVGIAGVNSLLFASYGISKRIISPFPQLSLPQISLAGSFSPLGQLTKSMFLMLLVIRCYGRRGKRHLSQSRGNVQSTYARTIWFCYR